MRDVATRRYPVHFQSYPALLADPKRTIEATLEWIGAGDVEAALAAVAPDLHHQRENELDDRELFPEGIDGGHLAAFDALFEAVHATRSLDPDLVRRLNATNDALLPFFLEQQATLRERALGADLDALDLAEPTGRGPR